MKYLFRYYPADYPPCPGDYNPFHHAVPNTTAWPYGSKPEMLDALRLVTGGEDPLPTPDPDCEPASERFARHICETLGPPPPEASSLFVEQTCPQKCSKTRNRGNGTPEF